MPKEQLETIANAVLNGTWSRPGAGKQANSSLLAEIIHSSLVLLRAGHTDYAEKLLAELDAGLSCVT
jgi:hypothetical protein